jgi:hypothetical protein
MLEIVLIADVHQPFEVFAKLTLLPLFLAFLCSSLLVFCLVPIGVQIELWTTFAPQEWYNDWTNWNQAMQKTRESSSRMKIDPKPSPRHFQVIVSSYLDLDSGGCDG